MFRKTILSHLKLCLVTDPKRPFNADYFHFIEKAVRGGVTMVQLREKNTNYDELKNIALRLKSILSPFNVPLIINDYVELAKEVDAEGVHLGQKDTDPLSARQYLGPDKIIGLSIEKLEQIHLAMQIKDALDYITASAVFPSLSKPDCEKIWGLPGLAEVIEQSSIPVTGIGGINHGNLQEVMEKGLYGVAVIGALHNTATPYETAQAFRQKLEYAYAPLSEQNNDANFRL